jgi:ribosome-associated toxin RatA of RatAB toxin-antitoxin module
MRRLGTCLVLLLGLYSTRAQAQVNVAQTVADRLRDGTITVSDVPYDGTDVRWGRATALIDARPDVVMRIVTDYARYAEFLPHFRVSRVLSQRGTSALVYLEAVVIHNTTTLWSQMRIRPRPDVGPTHVIEANMDRGNVDRMAARWEVTPVDNGQRTIVTFQFIIEPDVPFPDAIITDQNLRAARRTLESLRTRVILPEFVAQPAIGPSPSAAALAAPSGPAGS